MTTKFHAMTVWECKDCHYKEWVTETTSIKSCPECKGYMYPWSSAKNAPRWSRAFEGVSHARKD